MFNRKKKKNISSLKHLSRKNESGRRRRTRNVRLSVFPSGFWKLNPKLSNESPNVRKYAPTLLAVRPPGRIERIISLSLSLSLLITTRFFVTGLYTLHSLRVKYRLDECDCCEISIRDTTHVHIIYLKKMFFFSLSLSLSTTILYYSFTLYTLLPQDFLSCYYRIVYFIKKAQYRNIKIYISKVSKYTLLFLLTHIILASKKKKFGFSTSTDCSSKSHKRNNTTQDTTTTTTTTKDI
jgi:hypothetical protein